MMRRKNHSNFSGLISRGQQRGAALVVGLMLLLVLTLLAISGMNTSTLELQMAGNFQYSQNAFQAAEIGIEQTLASGQISTNASVEVEKRPITGSETDSPDTYETTTTFDCDRNGETLPLDGRGYSMGEGTGFSSYHFEITSTGESARGARSVNVQDFYIVRQEGGCP